MTPEWTYCFTCRDYARERGPVLAPALADKARREDRGAVEVVDEFMSAAHRRHVTTGVPLREGGPTTVTNPIAGRILSTWSLLGSLEEEQ